MISEVSARAKTRQQIGQTTIESVPAQIAGGIGDALTQSVPLNSSPGDGLTLHNHGGQSTAVSVNGAPIFPTGFQTQLGLLGADVFGSSSTTNLGAASSPDGGVGLQTLDPTIDWSGILQERPATQLGNAFTVSERGTAGRIGVAAAYSQAASSDPLQDAYYTDQSGLTYAHDAQTLSGGETVTFRYGFDTNHVAWFDAGRLELTNPLICRLSAGPLPCGFGPGNRSVDATNFLQLRDSIAIDDVSLNLHVFTSRTFEDTEFENRVLFGMPSPISASSQTSRTGIVGDASILTDSAHAARLEFAEINNQTASAGGAQPGIPAPSQANVTQQAILNVPVASGRHGDATLIAGENGVGSAVRFVYGAGATYKATSRDSFALSARTGMLDSPQGGVEGIAAPDELAYDCSAGRALGAGPFGNAAADSTSQYRFDFTHGVGTFSASVSAYSDRDAGALEAATVPAQSLNPALFASGYLQRANAIARDACGRAQFLTIPRLSYAVFGPVGSAVYDGAEASVGADVTPRGHVDVSYGIERARAFDVPPPLSSPGSNVVAGSQIPYAPLHRATLSARYAASRAVTAIVALNYLGANNQYQAAPLTSLDAGLRVRTDYGDVVLAAQNLTGAAASQFAHFTTFPAIDRPLGPTVVSARFRFALGRENVDRTQYLSSELRAASTLFMIPTPYEPVQSQASWLKPATDRPFCGPEDLPAADRLFSAVRAYVAEIDRARIAAPALAVFEPRTAGPADLSYIPLPHGYAIKIAFPNERARDVAPFMKCAVIHYGSFETASSLGLYVPGWRERAEGAAIYYAPQAGLYAAPAPVDANGSQPAEAGAPRDSFAVADDACPATYRAAVRDTAAALEGYVRAFYAGGSARKPAGLQIVAHAAKRDTWLEIKADERAYGDAIVRCLQIGAIGQAKVTALGWGGAVAPSFNYAPGLGLYTIDQTQDP